MATETGDPARIHQTLDEVVSLHPVLVRRAVREMREAKLADFVLLQSPVVGQLQAHVKAYRPIVIAPTHPILHRPALGMALDAGVIRRDEIHPRRSKVVELRYFGGLNNTEAAAVLKVSEATIERDWRFAKAWLYRELQQ